MLAHINGLTLAGLIVVPLLVILGFAIYSNRGIRRRYRVTRVTGEGNVRGVSRHYTNAGATRKCAEYAAYNASNDLYRVEGA